MFNTSTTLIIIIIQYRYRTAFEIFELKTNYNQPKYYITLPRINFSESFRWLMYYTYYIILL